MIARKSYIQRAVFLNYSFVNYLQFVTYVNVITAQPLQAVGSLVVLAVEDEVRRRLGYEQCPQKEHRRRYGYQQRALPPIQVRARDVRE